MFGALVESQPRRQRRAGGLAASIVAHAAVIGLAVQVTAGHAGAPPVEPVTVVHLPFPAPPPAPPAHSLGSRFSSGGGPPAGPALPAPPGIPTRIPLPGAPIPDQPGGDLGDVLSGLQRAGPSGRGGGGADGGSYVPGVDAAAEPLPGNPEPVYPPILRASGVQGRVRAWFVVDTTGLVEPRSIRLEATGSDLFAVAVRRALERARFIPARAAGRPARVLMEREFVFRIAGR